ncbi:MAG: hypothetical protein SF123_23850 [Chloroflexota bacterium]|nr:hypothetical protein [Chloroflexota bacterium]
MISKSVHFVRMAVLAICVLLSNANLNMAQDNTSSLGYIVQGSANNLALQSVRVDAQNELSVAATQSTEMTSNSGETWNYLTLSPDANWLAGVVEGMNRSFTLDIRNTLNNQSQRISLPSLSNLDTDSSYWLRWSPDSRKVVIEPPILTLETQIYDLTTQQLHILPTGYFFPLRWLPDSNRFLVDGPSVGGDTIYLGEIRDTTIHLQPLAILNREALGLNTSRGFSFRAPIYNVAQDRFYVTLAEATDIGPAVERLYSFDMEGVLRLEADIGANVDANSPQPLRTILYYSIATAQIYLLVENSTPSRDTMSQTFGLFRLGNEQNLVSLVTLIFPRTYEGIRYLLESEVSSDGRYLALGFAGQATLNRGNLIVIDLLNETTVLERNDLAQVCELSWSGDSANVLFSQQQEGGCTRYIDNQPMNQLVAQNVQTLTASVVYEDALTPFFYLPPGG